MNIIPPEVEGAVSIKGIPPVSQEDAVREVKILLLVGKHENIIQCYGAQHLILDNIFHIFLEYIPGYTLDKLLADLQEDDKKMKKKFIRKVVKQMLSGLAHLHSKRVTHGDIHAGNIMLHQCKEKVYIIDFGMAYQHSNDLSESNKMWHSGRVRDTRDVARLIYQLVMAPTPARESDNEIAMLMKTNQPNRIKSKVSERCDILGQVVFACLQERPTQECEAIFEQHRNTFLRLFGL